ncbi:MAG: hypothetical protein ABF289_02035 [Clostridiales bacterium]
MNRKSVLSVLIFAGIICYFYGFIFFNKMGMIFMGGGIFLILIPTLYIGINIRHEKKIFSWILIILSVFFISIYLINLMFFYLLKI